MSNQFREIDRSQPITLPGNLEGWLDGNDLAHFIVEVVEVLDTREIEAAYRGGGSAPYPPKMLLALLFYCYAKGIFTSRKIERATYELIPVVYLTGGDPSYKCRFFHVSPAHTGNGELSVEMGTAGQGSGQPWPTGNG